MSELPPQIIAAVREKLTDAPAWVAFGVRTQALFGPAKTILNESAGGHRCKVDVDGHGVLCYSRRFPNGTECVAYADLAVYRQLPAVAIGLEWADSTSTLRLASSPQGLPAAAAIPARPRAPR